VILNGGQFSELRSIYQGCSLNNAVLLVIMWRIAGRYSITRDVLHSEHIIVHRRD